MNKNLVAALSAALVVGAAGTVFAAPVIKLSGSIDSKLQYNQKNNPSDASVIKGGSGTHTVKLATELNAGDAVKGVIVFKALDGSVLPNKNNMAFATPNDWSIGVDKAYLQTTGAFWKNGQAVTTTIGDYDAIYSPYIAKVEGREGVKMEGVKLGPVAMNGFYGFKDADENAVYGGQASTTIAGLGLTGTAVRYGTETDLHGNAGFSPIKGMNMKADYAVSMNDGADKTDALMLDSSYAMNPMLTVRAGYRDFDVNFNPHFRDLTKNDDGSFNNIVDLNRGEKGVHLGADTAIAGVNGHVDYDQPENWLESKADTTVAGFKLNGRVKMGTKDKFSYTESEGSIEKTMPIMGLNVTSKYDLLHHDLNGSKAFKHSFDASTAVSVLALQNVGLSGHVEKDGSNKAAWNVKSTYTAPNGFVLGAGYDSVIGANASAGLTLNF